MQLEASQLARSLDDVDLAQGYPSFIKLAGTADPNSALLFDGVENKLFAIQWVVRPESAERSAHPQVHLDLSAFARRARRARQGVRHALRGRVVNFFERRMRA